MTVSLGCGIQGMLAEPAGSVSLVLCDLPSGATRRRFDNVPDLGRFWDAVAHVSAPGAISVVMASSIRFAAKLIASNDESFRYDLVWSKSVGTGFLNAKRMPLRAHEFVLVFGDPGGTYSPQMLEGGTPIHAATRRHGHGDNYGPQSKETSSRAGATDRFPRSVLSFASVGTTAKERTHSQQKPVPLLEWLVRTYSKDGDIVCDPFAGSGSALLAAEKAGRRFIGWDADPEYGRQP